MHGNGYLNCIILRKVMKENRIRKFFPGLLVSDSETSVKNFKMYAILHMSKYFK
jgi:hypothetical protein